MTFRPLQLSRLARIVVPSLLLFASACASDEEPAADETGGPTSDYDALMAGAPDNSTLPDDNKADAQYPAKFDLLQDQSPVKSQASRGVCSIFSTTALMESLYIKAGMPMPDFSEQYLQWSVKVQLGMFTDTDGSNAQYNINAISQFGIVNEAAWPYEGSPWTTANDPACTGEARPTRCYTNGEPPASAASAKRYKLPRSKYINTNSIKAHLVGKKTGVVVGVDFFYQAWGHRRSTIPVNAEYSRKGYVLNPSAKDVEESHTQRAGHSILIVGWDDTIELPRLDEKGEPLKDADGKLLTDKGAYIFKNSWGTSWALESPIAPGYGLISMKYIQRYGSAVASDVPELEPEEPTPTGAHFEATPNADIPDADDTGVSHTITATGSGTVAGVTIDVKITHPYIGDVTVTVTHAGRTATLRDREGGADDNLMKSFTVSDFDGLPQAGDWTITVVDGARSDEGTLDSWALTFM